MSHWDDPDRPEDAPETGHEPPEEEPADDLAGERPPGREPSRGLVSTRTLPEDDDEAGAFESYSEAGDLAGAETKGQEP